MRRRVVPILINLAVVIAVAALYRQDGIDRFGLLAIAGIGLLVFNAMYSLARTEPTLPGESLRRANRRIFWPIAVVALLVLLVEHFCKR